MTFDAAVLDFVTHRYCVEEKFEFYRRVSAVLAKGGGLVHGDSFDYSFKWLSRLAHEFGKNGIEKQLTDPDTAFYPHFSEVRHIAPLLREAWVEHWNHTHIYRPMQAKREYTYKSHVDMLQKLKFA